MARHLSSFSLTSNRTQVAGPLAGTDLHSFLHIRQLGEKIENKINGLRYPIADLKSVVRKISHRASIWHIRGITTGEYEPHP